MTTKSYSFLFRHRGKIGIGVIILMLLFVGLAGVAGLSWYQLWKIPPITEKGAIDVALMGQKGDFFGGHVASVVSSLTLALAIVLSYFQTFEATRANLRSHFLEGMNLVLTALNFETPEMDAAHQRAIRPTTKVSVIPHATLRILDYYSRLALELDDEEFYLIVAMMVAGDVKKSIRHYSENGSESYVYAQKAWKRIQDLRMDTEMERKEVEGKT